MLADAMALLGLAWWQWAAYVGLPVIIIILFVVRNQQNK